MSPADSEPNSVLNLRPGELVEIRSAEEIFGTLDENARLGALPFMPEMLAYCGRQFRVYKRSNKTCDTVNHTGSRRMQNTVHLEGLRCDGMAHGGCQARCFLFWKEAWLKRVQADSLPGTSSSKSDAASAPTLERVSSAGAVTRETVMRATRRTSDNQDTSEEVFACQATELLKASTPLAWWDMRQHVRDLRSGNISAGELFNSFFFWLFKKALGVGGYRALVSMYTRFQRARGRRPYPFGETGQLTKTPVEALDLQPGEVVQVKPMKEIVQTLNRDNKNRGLSFDPEMTPYCGGTYRVLQRVDQIIDEQTGKMRKIPGVCIMLDGVICKAHYSTYRLFCPRSIYLYWREIWLQRVSEPADAKKAGHT